MFSRTALNSPEILFIWPPGQAWPNAGRLRPTSGQSRPTWATLAPHGPMLGGCWPRSADFGRRRPNADQIWSQFGQVWAISGRNWPKLAGIDRAWAGFGPSFDKSYLIPPISGKPRLELAKNRPTWVGLGVCGVPPPGGGAVTTPKRHLSKVAYTHAGGGSSLFGNRGGTALGSVCRWEGRGGRSEVWREVRWERCPDIGAQGSEYAEHGACAPRSSRA